MKMSRLVLCLNSIIVILVAMFYLSDIAMAQSPNERKSTGKPPAPELDTFGDDGTPTFEDSPTWFVPNLPNGATVQWQIRRAGSATWINSTTISTWTHVQRVAGNLEIQAVVTLQGGIIRTLNLFALEARFPSADRILAGTGVQARMDQAWTDTKNATTATTRREEGYYITLNTDTGNYGITAHTIATPVANNQVAAWDTATFPRPPDSIANPSPLDKPTYTVAWFHTHTPTVNRTAAGICLPMELEA